MDLALRTYNVTQNLTKPNHNHVVYCHIQDTYWGKCHHTPHSPKLPHHWNLTIRLFSVISKAIVGGGGLAPLQRSSLCILLGKGVIKMFISFTRV